MMVKGRGAVTRDQGGSGKEVGGKRVQKKVKVAVKGAGEGGGWRGRVEGKKVSGALTVAGEKTQRGSRSPGPQHALSPLATAHPSIASVVFFCSACVPPRPCGRRRRRHSQHPPPGPPLAQASAWTAQRARVPGMGFGEVPCPVTRLNLTDGCVGEAAAISGRERLCLRHLTR